MTAMMASLNPNRAPRLRHLLFGQSGSVGVTAGTAACFALAAAGYLFAFFPQMNPMAELPGQVTSSAMTTQPATKQTASVPQSNVKTSPPTSPVVAPNTPSPPVAAAPERKAPAPEVRPTPVPAPPAPRRAPRPAPSNDVTEPPPLRTPAANRTPKPAEDATETAAPTPKPERKGGTGFINVDADPWADVAIDGSVVDRTPIAELPLPAGPHSVELTNDEIGAHVTKKITIRAGATQNLKVNLQSAGPAKPTEGQETPSP
jgi:hypothetical protein